MSAVNIPTHNTHEILEEWKKVVFKENLSFSKLIVYLFYFFLFLFHSIFLSCRLIFYRQEKREIESKKLLFKSLLDYRNAAAVDISSELVCVRV